MSADLYLIAAPNDPKWAARYAFLNGAEFITGSDDEDLVRTPDGYLAYPDGPEGQPGPRGLSGDQYAALRAELGLDGYDRLDRCWVGQLSWIGASLSGDVDANIPAPLQRIAILIGEGRTLTPGLAGDLVVALNRANRSMYGRRAIHRFDAATYASMADSWNRARPSERRLKYKPLRSPMVLARKPDSHAHIGVVRARALKTWLAAHQGAWLVAESE